MLGAGEADDAQVRRRDRAVELAADRAGAGVGLVAAQAPRRRRDRRSARRRPGAPAKPSGYSSAMKPVVSAPARKRGCCISAERKSTLWPIPSICEGVERRDLPVDRLLAGRRPGDQLGDHRIVEDRDLAALGDAVVDAHALLLAPAGGSGPAGRSRAGSRDRDPRHRCGSRPTSRRASRRPGRRPASRRRRRGSSARRGRGR